MEKLLLTCETCGGVLNYAADGKSAVCPFCGNEYFFKEEKSEALILALNRANAYRLANDFDGAITEYKLVAERNPSDAEAFWGLAISTYGIEYVEDPHTKKRVPTCRRTVKKSILEDENYLKALENASDEQKEVYERRAAVIDRLQKNIKRRLEDEEDFDVFISFKSTDENGNPTPSDEVIPGEEPPKRMRRLATIMSLLNSLLGAGILGVPGSMHHIGIIPSVIMIGIIALLSHIATVLSCTRVQIDDPGSSI